MIFVSQAHWKIILNQYMKFQSKRRVCGITDIALALKISKPSVNRAVNTLKKQGLVSHEPYGDIILTEKGFELGEAVYHRHTMIKKFLVNVLHIPEDDAEKEACQIEHNISQNTVEKMKSFMEN